MYPFRADAPNLRLTRYLNPSDLLGTQLFCWQDHAKITHRVSYSVIFSVPS